MVMAHAERGLLASASLMPNRKAVSIWNFGEGLPSWAESANAQVPETIGLMRQEYRAWIAGHGLASCIDAVAIYLDELMALDPTAWGCDDDAKAFEMMGVDRKLLSLKKLTLEEDLRSSLGDMTRVRNCLIYRHGLVAPRDRNEGDSLVLRYRAVRISVRGDSSSPWSLLDDTHRGPASSGDDNQFGLLEIQATKLVSSLGTRIEFSASDFSSIQHTFGECVSSIETSAAALA